MCNVPCILCGDFDECEIISKNEIIKLRDFAIKLFDFVKSKGLLNKFNDKILKNIEECF